MLREQARQDVKRERTDKVQDQLNVSGDGLELAARVSEAQPGQMLELNDGGEFWRGYVTACRQLSAVLRSIRKAEPLPAGELELIANRVKAEVKE